VISGARILFRLWYSRHEDDARYEDDEFNNVVSDALLQGTWFVFPSVAAVLVPCSTGLYTTVSGLLSAVLQFFSGGTDLLAKNTLYMIAVDGEAAMVSMWWISEEVWAQGVEDRGEY